MSKKDALLADPDELEWDAEDCAGDESAYDGEAAEFITYDRSLFEETDHATD